MKERLQKYISRCGYTSRRKAEELIRNGFVLVNGIKPPPEGLLIDSEKDQVIIEGRLLTPPCEFVYYLLNKPEGYICTLSDPFADRVITELVPKEPRVYPVGRLDADSSGLIILTNDGEFANRVSHPSFAHEKEYEVYAGWKEVFPGKIKARKLISKLEKGVLIDDKKTAPAKCNVRRIDESGILFHITITEGRNRQVRKMCDSIGLYVKLLKRIRISQLEIGSLLPGEYILLSENDINKMTKINIT